MANHTFPPKPPSVYGNIALALATGGAMAYTYYLWTTTSTPNSGSTLNRANTEEEPDAGAGAEVGAVEKAACAAKATADEQKRCKASHAPTASLAGCPPGEKPFPASLDVADCVSCDVYFLEAPIEAAKGVSEEPMNHTGFGLVLHKPDGSWETRAFNMEAIQGMTVALLPPVEQLQAAATAGTAVTWANRCQVMEVCDEFAWGGPGCSAYWLGGATQVFRGVSLTTVNRLLEWAQMDCTRHPLYRVCDVISPTGACLLQANTCASFVVRVFAHLYTLAPSTLVEDAVFHMNQCTVHVTGTSVTPAPLPAVAKWAQQALEAAPVAQAAYATQACKGCVTPMQKLRLMGLAEKMGGQMLFCSTDDPAVSYLLQINPLEMGRPQYASVSCQVRGGDLTFPACDEV